MKASARRNRLNQVGIVLTILIMLLSPNVVHIFGQTQSRGAGVKPAAQASEKRLALVIGNGDYKKTAPLANPANDAADMANALKALGFEVLSGTNQSKRQMEVLIREFGDKLAKQGGVGLFFYAGHGLQVNGNNYLVPVEAEIPEQDEIEYAAVNLSFLLGKMDSAKNNLNIVILDACRNNPFARSWRSFRDIGDGKGLAKVTPPTGTIMLYSTQPGNVASDGTGRNGLFTESLLQEIKKPNVELDQMVKMLARDVSSKSQGKQLPWKEGIVLGDFYFAGTISNAAVNNPVREDPVPVVEIDKNAAEREAWNQIKDSANRSDFDLFVQTFPNGIYAASAKSKWEIVWWNSIKSSPNKSDFDEFLRQFPIGQYAGAAKFAVKRLESPASQAANNPVDLNNTSAQISSLWTENGRNVIPITAVKKNNPTNQIKLGEVYLYDNGVEQKIENLEADSSPARIVLLVDNSLAGNTDAEKLKAAVREFAYEIFNGDQLAIITSQQKTEVIQGWTDDAKKIEASLTSFRKQGNSYLFDALKTSISEVLAPVMTETRKTAVVLISNGFDQGSTESFEKVLSELQTANITVYALQIPDNADRLSGNSRLKSGQVIEKLTDETGGKIFTFANPQIAAKTICDELRKNRYLISYKAASVSELHRILVITNDDTFIRSKAAEPPKP